MKTKDRGSIDKYKVHLVIKGYEQEHGDDYKETFAPNAKMIPTRFCYCYPLYHMDLKNAIIIGSL